MSNFCILDDYVIMGNYVGVLVFVAEVCVLGAFCC